MAGCGTAWQDRARQIQQVSEGKTLTANLIEQSSQTHIELVLKLTGEAPLMMHAPTLLDPLHPLTREMAKMTAKKASTRTIADIERMSRLEWEAGLYQEDALGPFIPALNVKKSFQMAAGRWKLGAAVSRGVTFATTKVPVQYDGPRDRDGLYDAGFKDVRPIKNGGFNAGRVMRTRPCFEEWVIEPRIYVDPHEIGVEDLAKVVERSQRYGVGDHRPEFGLFSAEMWKVEA